MYRGDIRLGDTIDIKFTTRRGDTGAPTTLAGSPAIAAYVGNSTTEITAGITLSVDFDSRTGLNNVRVVATSGNGYATASNIALVLTAGTVNAVSVVGEVVGSFSIENRSALMPTTVARTLVVDAAGLADANAVKVGPTGSGTAQTARDLGAALPNAAPNAAGGLLITAAGSLDMDELNVDIEAIQASTAGLTFTVANKVDVNVLNWRGDAVPTPSVTGRPLVDVWDWLGSPPNALLAGKLDALNQMNTGTAQGGTASTITLSASSAAVDDFYTNNYLQIVNSGSISSHLITAYNGSTQVATVYPNFVTNPTSSTVYAIVPSALVDVWYYGGGRVQFSSLAGIPDVNLIGWNGATPNNLISGRIDANAQIAAGQLFVKKNVALANYPFVMTDSTTHAPKPGLGAGVTATRRIDNAGSFSACANAP